MFEKVVENERILLKTKGGERCKKKRLKNCASDELMRRSTFEWAILATQYAFTATFSHFVRNSTVAQSRMNALEWIEDEMNIFPVHLRLSEVIGFEHI